MAEGLARSVGADEARVLAWNPGDLRSIQIYISDGRGADVGGRGEVAESLAIKSHNGEIETDPYIAYGAGFDGSAIMQRSVRDRPNQGLTELREAADSDGRSMKDVLLGRYLGRLRDAISASGYNQ
jgi:hypothetical protein